MKIDQIIQQSDVERCFELMVQLRPHLHASDFYRQLQSQFEQGYRLNALSIDHAIVALMGYRFTTNLVSGKFIYIDDLVTDRDHRRQGYAQRLLDWADSLALEHQCGGVQLHSGFDNHSAHQLYLQHGFQLASPHFNKPVVRSPITSNQ